MKNQPMTSKEHEQLLHFSLLMIPSVIFLIGIIPAIFLSYGIYMMNKHKDFPSIERAVKKSNIYIFIILAGCTLNSIILGIESINRSRYFDDFLVSLAFIGIGLFYLKIIKNLFYSPLVKHKEWIESNGIFTIKHKSKIEIVKTKNFKTYFTSDELLKWAKLAESGYISKEEFNEVRNNILNKKQPIG